MKTKQICIVLFAVIAVIAFCNVSYGQDKSVYDSELLDLGDGKIISSTLNDSEDYVIQEFIVEVERAGKYYLAAWVNGGMDLNGEKLTYSVLVNSEKEEHIIRAEKGHPHAVDFGEQMFDLVSGVNRIYFKTRKPFCPNVEFIKVSQDEQNREISSEKYDNYIDEISNQQLPDNYAEIKEVSLTEELSNAGLKSAPNPQCNYEYEMELDFRYTWCNITWLGTGTVTFETVGATSDPVMHLFKTDDPATHSWTDDDGGSGYNSKIVANITSPGSYWVLIRKYSNPSSVVGTCNLYRNGSLAVSNCPISGSRIQCDKSVSEELNWFTADLTGDSRIWIENQSGYPGKIIAYNDDWLGDSDFSWGLSSRVRSNLNTSIRATIVSHYSSYNPTGNCDVYMNCMNSSTSLPIQNDAIKSGSGSFYNCYGWSGGRLTKEDPASSYSPWYGDDDLDSFDNYYKNIDNEGEDCFRYGPPAMRFIRLGDDATDGHIALWEKSGIIVHASVKKPANDQPHGYDWESKDGGDDRLFHPKNAIGGFGNIEYYYNQQGYSYSSESSKKSAIIHKKVSLASDKQLLLNKMVNAYSDMERFEKLYESWKETWDNPMLINHSSSRMHANSNQYGALLGYCKERGKAIWPVIFDKYLDGEEIIDLLILDLTKEEYLMVIDSIRYKQNLEARINNTSPSQRTNVINFVAFLLGELEQKFERGQNSIAVSNFFTCDQNQSFNVYPNPAGNTITIKIVGLKQTNMIIKICDLSGKVLKSVSEEVSGDFTYSINIEDIPDGTYLCKIESSNAVNTIKFNVVK